MDIFDNIDITHGNRNGEPDCCQGIQSTGVGRIDEKRMYCFVLRQLSPIQKGIQAAHSVAEYMLKYKNEQRTEMWAYNDKTLVLLDGGDADEIEETYNKLVEIGVPVVAFRESSLKDIVTSVCIIADERCWNKTKFPDYDGVYVSYGNGTDYDERQYGHLVGMGLTHCDIELRNIVTNRRTAL